jgi:hypothetical protein
MTTLHLLYRRRKFRLLRSFVFIAAACLPTDVEHFIAKVQFIKLNADKMKMNRKKPAEIKPNCSKRLNLAKPKSSNLP